jgi:hypothetical protein
MSKSVIDEIKDYCDEHRIQVQIYPFPKDKHRFEVALDNFTADELSDVRRIIMNYGIDIEDDTYLAGNGRSIVFHENKSDIKSLKESKDEYDIKYDLVINALRLCWKADLILEDTYKRYKNKSVKIKNIDDAYDFAYTILYGKENDMLEAFHELMNLLHIEDFEKHFGL